MNILSNRIPCTGCSQPRSKRHFLHGHIKFTRVEPDEICAICREAFGAPNCGMGMMDTAVKVIGIPDCSHVFGEACLLQSASRSNKCPLCRTSWFDEPTQEQIVEARTAFLSWAHQTDHLTARLVVTTQGQIPVEYSQDVEELGLRMLALNTFSDLMKRQDVKKEIEKLAESQVSQIDTHLYDPFANQSEFYAYGNPFTFQNWQAQPEVIAFVAYQAFISNNGTRCWDLLVSYMRLVTNHGFVSQDTVTMHQILDIIENYWIEWYGEEDIRIFSRFFIRLLMRCLLPSLHLDE